MKKVFLIGFLLFIALVLIVPFVRYSSPYPKFTDNELLFVQLPAAQGNECAKKIDEL